MGETREDRCDLAFSLKELGANVVPINILNPIPGTPFEKNPPLAPMEILKTIACFRFILPRQEIMIAGGRTVEISDRRAPLHGHAIRSGKPCRRCQGVISCYQLGNPPRWTWSCADCQPQGGARS